MLSSCRMHDWGHVTLCFQDPSFGIDFSLRSNKGLQEELGKLINAFSVPVPSMERRKRLFNFLFTAPISHVSPEWRWLERAALVSSPGWRFPYPTCLDLQFILLILPERHLSTTLCNVSCSDSGCFAELCCLC